MIVKEECTGNIFPQNSSWTAGGKLWLVVLAAFIACGFGVEGFRSAIDPSAVIPKIDRLTAMRLCTGIPAPACKDQLTMAGAIDRISTDYSLKYSVEAVKKASKDVKDM